MRLSHIFGFFILWLNLDKSLQQNEMRCSLTLPPLEGTRYEPADRSEFSPGETVRVICTARYWISNPQDTSAVTTCGADGEWTVSPVCQEFLCSNPQDPLVQYWGVEFGKHRKFGEYADYRCKPGYKKTDSIPRAVCTRGGWRPDPLCQEIMCDRQDIQNADIVSNDKQKYKHNEQVNYLCKDGYKESLTLTCGENGWTGVSQCKVLQCPGVYVDYNVAVNGSLEAATVGSVVQFSCKSNTEFLIGPQEIYCDEHGEWSGTAPRCLGTTCKPPEIENGEVLGDKLEYNEDDILHFQCNYKFKRIEERPSKCTKIGVRAEWSPTPVCESVKCRLKLPPLEGTSYEPAIRNVFSADESVRVTCGYKFYISDPRETSVETRCGNDGEWTIRPVCLEVTCRNQRPRHVYRWDLYWGQKITLDDTTRYSCSSGYKSTDGTNVAKCTREGWKPDPLCQEITCHTKDIFFLNGDVRNPNKQIYRLNERVYFDCHRGYEGNPSRVCRESGWTGDSRCTAL